MVEMVVFSADGKARRRLRAGAIPCPVASRAPLVRPRPRPRRGMSAIGLLCLLCIPLASCFPTYDWREIKAPGGEYRVHLPAKPATLTRQIHLEALAVEMTMQGARVEENTFTVAMVPVPAGSDGKANQSASAKAAAGLADPGLAEPGEEILRAMREQMLRNIGAEPSTPSRPVVVIVVDDDGAKIGEVKAQGVAAAGAGKSVGMDMRARFVLWQGQALQIVAIGPRVDPEQADYFLDSLRLVKR
jgi:hypothetical protein